MHVNNTDHLQKNIQQIIYPGLLLSPEMFTAVANQDFITMYSHYTIQIKNAKNITDMNDTINLVA